MSLLMTLYKTRSFLFFLGCTSAASLCAKNTFSVMAELVYMQRNKVPNERLALNCADPACKCTNVTVLNSNKLVRLMDYAPGFRAGASFTHHKKWSLEANFLDIPYWKGERTVHKPGTLCFPFSSAGFDHDFTQARKATGRYTTALYTAEINYWDHVTPPYENYLSGSWMLGIRSFLIPEKFNLIYERDENRSDYKIHTRNYVGGFQAGINAQWNPTQRMSWDAVAKLGPAINYAMDRVRLSDFNNTKVLRSYHKHTYAWSMISELSLTLGYRWASYFQMHIGYQLIYLTGLALAPEQLDRHVSIEGKLATGGSALYHGAYAGIRF